MQAIFFGAMAPKKWQPMTTFVSEMIQIPPMVNERRMFELTQIPLMVNDGRMCELSC